MHRIPSAIETRVFSVVPWILRSWFPCRLTSKLFWIRSPTAAIPRLVPPRNFYPRRAWRNEQNFLKWGIEDIQALPMTDIPAIQLPPDIEPLSHIQNHWTCRQIQINCLKLVQVMSSRSFRVQCINSLSSSRTSSCGVPQGSVLGPILFIIYTTPLSTLISSQSLNHHLYADNTQLFFSFYLHFSISHLQNAFSTNSSWMTANLLTLNSSKNWISSHRTQTTTSQDTKLPSQHHPLCSVCCGWRILCWLGFITLLYCFMVRL